MNESVVIPRGKERHRHASRPTSDSIRSRRPAPKGSSITIGRETLALSVLQRAVFQSVTEVRIGTCSWADDALSKYFYPPKLPAKERLAYYAEHFDTVEVDSTYYRLPASRWCRAGPTARRPASRCT